MVRSKEQDEGKVGRIDTDTASKGAEKLRKIYQDQLASTPIKKPDTEPEKKGADQFHHDSGLPKFLSSVRNRMDGSWVYQSFKLPGTTYVVRDMRGAQMDEKEALRMAAEYQVQEGNLTKTKKKDYVNYLADRSFAGGKSKQAEAEIGRMLSEFEKLLVERFEKDRTIELALKDGRAVYREKSDEEWKSFFETFLPRTVKKSGDLSAVKEMTYRGKMSGSLLVGDIIGKDGAVDKFARIKVLEGIFAELAGNDPGLVIGADLISKYLATEEFKYLAIAHKHQEQAIKTGKEASKGIFGDLRTEDEIAKKLGLKRKASGYEGPIAWGEAAQKGTYVPADIGQKKKEPNLRKIIIFIAIITAAIIGITLLVKLL